MELVRVARVLRRHRIVVVIGLLAAVTLGAKVSGVLSPSGAGISSGQALARVLVDTREPLIATTAQQGAETIAERSSLLAILMASNQAAASIAYRAGVQSGQLAVVAPQFAPVSAYTYLPDGEFPGLTATAAQEAAGLKRFVVELRTDATVPIIDIGVAAPDVRQAAAVAQATVATLTSASVGTGGAFTSLRAEALGPVRTAVVKTASSHRLLGIAAAVGAFLAWCTAIVIASGLRRLWRRPTVAALNGAS